MLHEREENLKKDLINHEKEVLIIRDALIDNKTDDASSYVEYYKLCISEELTLNDKSITSSDNLNFDAKSVIFKIFECAMKDYSMGKYDQASELFLLYSQLVNLILKFMLILRVMIQKQF